jgi:putative GTP pyrophosphokinase
MATDSKSPDEWGELYRSKRPEYEQVSNKVKGLLEELLTSADIDVVEVDARAKDIASLVDKLDRKRGKYTRLDDVLDLAGVRVIAYYIGDLPKIGALIEEEFEIDGENSWRRESVQEPDRFGYVSDHYIIRCGASRRELREWQPYVQIPIEVQVRTVLQHAWAAIDHKLAYKKESDVPEALRRQLSRVSALLEIGDEQFEAARATAASLQANYDSRAQAGDLTLPLDVAAIRAYLVDNALAHEVASLAEEVGFTISRNDDEGLADLAQASRMSDFQTISDLDEFLKTIEPRIEPALKAMTDAGISMPGEEWRASIPFLIASLVWAGSPLDLATVEETTDSADFYMQALKAGREILA